MSRSIFLEILLVRHRDEATLKQRRFLVAWNFHQRKIYLKERGILISWCDSLRDADIVLNKYNDPSTRLFLLENFC